MLMSFPREAMLAIIIAARFILMRLRQYPELFRSVTLRITFPHRSATPKAAPP